jgi:hypothetical protein
MNDEEFKSINENVEERLERESTSNLLDYIGGEFEHLHKTTTGWGETSYEGSLSQIEAIIENTNEPLTQNQKEKIKNIVFTVTFMHNTSFNSSEK